MHLVLLWFGSYKNGISTYVPSWVKQNVKRSRAEMLLERGECSWRAEDIGREYADWFGFFFDEDPEPRGRAPEKWVREFPDVQLVVTGERAFVFGEAGPGGSGGMVIHRGKGNLSSCWSAEVSTRPTATFTGILWAEEKEPDPDRDGKLRTLRVLNGDETRSGKFVIMTNEDPDYGGFPFADTIPFRAAIAEVQTYWLEESEEDI